MKADEFVYPPGTLVANWYTILWDKETFRVMVGVFEVTEEGYYRSEDNIPITEVDVADLELGITAALRWIEQHGYIHEPDAYPNIHVPRKGDVVRAGLRKVSQ